MFMYKEFNYRHCNIIINFLENIYEIKFTDNIDEADIVIHGVWSKNINKVTLPKKFNILWGYESININFNRYNLVFSGTTLDKPNIINIPLFYYYGFNCVNSFKLNINKTYNKTDFCCFLVSNENGYDIFSETEFKGCQLRNNFFKKLNSIKKVNSGGKVFNNINEIVPKSKTKEFISKHKFMICFENSDLDGYITEKIFQAFENNTIPIYWGNKNNYRFLNENAFIKYSTCEETIKKVLDIDSNDILYNKMLNNNILSDEKFVLKNYLDSYIPKFNSIIKSYFKNNL